MVHRQARRRPASLLLLAAAMGCGFAPPAPARTGPDPAAASLRSARQAVDACLRQLDPAVDTDYARINARCPGLAPTLIDAPFAPWLPSDWNESDGNLSAAGLKQLDSLLVREGARTPLREAPPVERVRAALAALHSHARPQGWWERLWRWLRGLATDGEQPALPWWQRWFSGASISQRALHLTVWGVVASLIILAVSVLVNELRVAGVLRRRRPRRAAHTAEGAAPRDAPDPDTALPEQRPALLLEQVAQRLVEQERLPPARAFTARQLVRRARLAQAADRERLERLAQVSEQLRFSDRPVPAQRIAEAIGQGRELLASLYSPATVDHG
ncbi:MAG: DUF4129 domain-containing protein [Proteobacteria bacterium]|nr:DUF4129 domain-containing protein [Pseudomonadota bacterium]